MAKIKQVVKRRVKKNGSKSGYVKCNVCNGRGYHKSPTRKKK